VVSEDEFRQLREPNQRQGARDMSDLIRPAIETIGKNDRQNDKAVELKFRSASNSFKTPVERLNSMTTQITEQLV